MKFVQTHLNENSHSWLSHDPSPMDQYMTCDMGHMISWKYMSIINSEHEKYVNMNI
jgi:hypothetical protein